MPIILLALVVLAPVFGGIFLFARKPTKTGLAVRWISLVLVVCFLVYALVWRRSVPGRTIRYFMGAPVAQQLVDDQADDLRRSPSLPQIQGWAVETLRRYRLGQVSTNGDASYWSLGKVKVAPTEVPDFVRVDWNESEPPEISIGLSESGSPEFVVVAWYSKGVAFGDQAYRIDLSDHHLFKQAAPGVYAFWISK